MAKKLRILFLWQNIFPTKKMKDKCFIWIYVRFFSCNNDNDNYWNCHCIWSVGWLASAKKLQSLQSLLTVVLQWSDRPGFTNRFFSNHTHCPFRCNQSNFLCQWTRLEFWIQLLSWRSNWPDWGRHTVHGTQLNLRWHYCSTIFSPCSPIMSFCLFFFSEVLNFF